MKRIYHLGNCTTCQEILRKVNPPKNVELIDIKENNIDGDTLDWIKSKVGSYEALFSKRAMKYRGMGLHEMKLTEADYRKYMLEEYTFLKRPFIIYDDNLWIGNAKKDVDSAVEFFSKL
ncbi:MAG TPA: ArsC/Spx/MgsR family protein [Fluviicola sp.]|nr:ArsC/Spx/MgsR family protein [Fluviicola sp.]